jgi:hypothetical protein
MTSDLSPKEPKGKGAGIHALMDASRSRKANRG